MKKNIEFDSTEAIIISQEITAAEKSLGSSLTAVGIFGSGICSQEDPYSAQSYTLALQLSEKRISVITGGGGGIMEAANKGAQQGKGESIGLCLKLPEYERKNKFIHPEKTLMFSSFFARKAIFLKYIKAVVCFPGGVGTLDEFFEVMLALRAKKLDPLPFYLVGIGFWSPLINWLQQAVIKQKFAPQEILDHITMTDDINEVIKGLIDHFLSRHVNEL